MLFSIYKKPIRECYPKKKACQAINIFLQITKNSASNKHASSMNIGPLFIYTPQKSSIENGYKGQKKASGWEPEAEELTRKNCYDL